MERLGLSLLYNSLWIVGMALFLAIASYHYDRAQKRQGSFRKQTGSRSFIIGAWTSATLVTLGLAGTSSRSWEAAIWVVFAVISIVNVVSAWRATPDSTGQEPLPED